MPRKIPDARILHAKSLIEAGSTLKHAAAAAGCHPDVLSVHLRKLGISIPKPGTHQVPMQLPSAAIQAYEAGEGCPRIAARYGVSRTTIEKFLKRNNVQLRPRHVANKLLAEARTPEQKVAYIQAARQQRWTNLRDASFDETSQRYDIGTGYHFVAGALQLIGINPARQVPWNGYYIDLAIGNIAIEVEYCPRMAFKKGRSKRMKELIEGGWTLIYLIHDGVASLSQHLRYLITSIQTICGAPAVPGQYWMIRCDLNRGVAYLQCTYGAAVPHAKKPDWVFRKD